MCLLVDIFSIECAHDLLVLSFTGIMEIIYFIFLLSYFSCLLLCECSNSSTFAGALKFELLLDPVYW
jgi:hypothetical protein